MKVSRAREITVLVKSERINLRKVTRSVSSLEQLS